MQKRQPEQQVMHTLDEQWERAVERAAQSLTREQELDTVALERARGLHLRTGVNAGQGTPAPGSATPGSYGYGSYSIATYPLVAGDILSYGSYGVLSTAPVEAA